MNSIKINGNSISFSGRGNVVISNGRVTVDGKDVTPEDQKQITISVEGDVEKLSIDCCDKITVNGNVGSIKTQSGDVDVTGDVTESIQTMSGDVDCGNVGGNISTMSGNVKHKKA